MTVFLSAAELTAIKKKIKSLGKGARRELAGRIGISYDFLNQKLNGFAGWTETQLTVLRRELGLTEAE